LSGGLYTIYSKKFNNYGLGQGTKRKEKQVLQLTEGICTPVNFDNIRASSWCLNIWLSIPSRLILIAYYMSGLDSFTSNPLKHPVCMMKLMRKCNNLSDGFVLWFQCIILCRLYIWLLIFNYMSHQLFNILILKKFEILALWSSVLSLMDKSLCGSRHSSVMNYLLWVKIEITLLFSNVKFIFTPQLEMDKTVFFL